MAKEQPRLCDVMLLTMPGEKTAVMSIDLVDVGRTTINIKCWVNLDQIAEELKKCQEK